MHHRYFECNYAGSDGVEGEGRVRGRGCTTASPTHPHCSRLHGQALRDVLRRFQVRLSVFPASPAVTIPFLPLRRDGDKEGAKLRADAKATLREVPTPEFLLYLGLAAACVAAWAIAAVTGAPVSTPAALGLAALAGFGPVVVASVLTAVFSGRTGGSAAQSFAATLGQVAVGSAFCSLPVAWAAYLTLAPPALLH